MSELKIVQTVTGTIGSSLGNLKPYTENARGDWAGFIASVIVWQSFDGRKIKENGGGVPNLYIFGPCDFKRGE